MFRVLLVRVCLPAFSRSEVEKLRILWPTMRNATHFYYGRTLSDASMLYFADVFYIFFMAALVGQTAERIFTKLSHVVDIRCYLLSY